MLRHYGTRYFLDGAVYTEEVSVNCVGDLHRKLAERGLSERLDESRWSATPRTDSALKQFDEGKYIEAAHGACQMLRLQNDSRKALEALNDHGLVHMLVHIALYSNEPAVISRLEAVRTELASLEARIRPGLNT